MAEQNQVVFRTINPEMVDRLKNKGIIDLPKKKIDVPKDKQWNQKQMTSKIYQGILRGSSVDDIAESMKSVVGNNEASAIRNTRTMITAAENQGRVDSYKELDRQGVVQKKEWMATPDDRVRPSHRDMDGEEQDIDKPFSNGLMFPGDGRGPAEEVWMCRCSMRDHIIGFRRADGSVSYIDYDEYGINPRGGGIAHEVVQGKDISETWKRREDEFVFEIEDVIDAQGFDGLPQVVSPEEFDRYVQEANDGNGFIAQRTYSAPDQATLNTYRDQLYNGKWYVDCSTGGAAYGQGMYCAGNYEGKLSDAIKQEMADYQRVNLSYSGKESVNMIETFTLDKSAKIIDYDDVFREYSGIMSLNEREQKIDKYIDNEISKLSKDEQTFANFNIGKKGVSWEEVSKAANKIGSQGQDKVLLYVNEIREQANNLVEAEAKEMMEKGKKIREKFKDVGSYAAAEGYDAICTTAGKSGADTVILNRTKVIFKGGNND